MQMYSNGVVDKPIIYANKCPIATQMHIPIFYTKYIFNQQYDIIISDVVIDDPKIDNMCRKVIYIDNETTTETIMSKIQESTIC